MTRARVPVLASWLVARVTPRSRRDELLGDLAEMLHQRRARSGGLAAWRWYWRQTGRAVTDAADRAIRRERGPLGRTLVEDTRHAWRALTVRPAFSSAAVALLALGLGANATVFSWVNAVLLDPLPGTTEPGRLVQLSYLYRGDPLTSFSVPDYRDVREGATELEGVAGRDDLAVGVVIDHDAERAWAEVVTANYFDVLGVPMALGRAFTPGDDRAGTVPTAVLAHRYWTGRFGADPDVIGRAVRVNAQVVTIVGVAAPGFQGGESGLAYDLWLPLGAHPAVAPGPSRLDARGSRWLTVIGRLAPHATPDTVRAELDRTIDRMRRAFAAEGRYVEHRGAVFALSASPNGAVAILRPVLLVLMAVALVVLLVTCANLAGLILARSSARQREMAVRLSMGASRGRLVRQLLLEGAMLSALGAVGAVAALRWTAGLLVGMAPPSELPIALSVPVDARVLAVTAACAFGTVLLFALAPAVQTAPHDVAGTLRDAGAAGRAFGRHRWRRALVAAQVALSVALLVGAGLSLRSLQAASRMTPGFMADGLVVGWLDLFSAGYDETEGRAFYTRLLDRVRALPGVTAATLGRRVPLGFTGPASSDFTVEGAPATDDIRVAAVYHVGPDYAATLGARVVAGRDLTDADTAGRTAAVMVNETLARTYWKDRSPIGGRVMFGQPRADRPPTWMTVVGVVADIKQRSLTERPRPTLYVPVLQQYASAMVLHVRTSGDPDRLAGDLQRAVRDLDPRVPFFNVGRLDDHAAAATFTQRLAGDVLTALGALAVLLAGIGAYGLLAFLVGLRRREIGIRLAVGATRRQVVGLVAGTGARVVGAGLALGLVLSAGVGAGLRGLLIGVTAADPVTYTGVVAVLTLVAGAACVVPARRAAALDPALTLRDE
ncbi:MAG: ADOP family duplicated permease [Vicinamibacterales bacterium]